MNLKKKKKYLPTYYLEGRVAKGERNIFLRLALHRDLSVLLVEQTIDLSQVTDKLYLIMLYTSPRLHRYL